MSDDSANIGKKVVDWLAKQPDNYDPSDDEGSDANDGGIPAPDESTPDSSPAIMKHSEEEECTETESSEEESSDEESSSVDSSPCSTPERKKRRKEKKKKKKAAAKRRKLYPDEDPEDEYPW